ncbi:MAG: Asp-tRNA(Asn)/Glu-tRNA(Gln) amidotransferase subunit GatC [Gammaproteobacteria bacterium]|nr:Asp-tRNA(Asn)/Glu-tRNA(Gln) amidotransferase subunit GatC [Gammaproteobacteria bacterium]
MSLSRDDVQKVAYLARLEFDAETLDRFTRTLSGILSFVEQMNAVDSSGIAPMAHPQDTPLRLRDDAVTEFDRREEFQAGAPQTEDGLYLVPRVIE